MSTSLKSIIVYYHSSIFLNAVLKLERKAACHPTIGDVINEAKLIPTVYSRLNCRQSLTLALQKQVPLNKNIV